MAVTLPDIGLNGLVNSVEKVGGYIANPGYRKVSPTAEFVAGMVAELTTDSDGNIVLDVADDTSSTGIIGLFYCHKTTSFYRPVVKELQTFGTSPNTATMINLSHPNIKAGSVRCQKVATPFTVYSESSNIIVNTTNGTITSSSGPGVSEAVYVSYLYQDPNLIGIDQTLGSGMAATIEDNGEIATLMYDSSVAYALSGSLYVTSDGYLTSTQSASAKVIGTITKPPTADDPRLFFKMKLA